MRLCGIVDKDGGNMYVYYNEKVSEKNIKDQFEVKKSYGTKLKPTIELRDQMTNCAKNLWIEIKFYFDDFLALP